MTEKKIITYQQRRGPQQLQKPIQIRRLHQDDRLFGEKRTTKAVLRQQISSKGEKRQQEEIGISSGLK